MVFFDEIRTRIQGMMSSKELLWTVKEYTAVLKLPEVIINVSLPFPIYYASAKLQFDGC